MRLGWGGTYATRRQEVLHVQREFLIAVEKWAPHVAQGLAQKPLQAYKAFYDNLPEKPTDFGSASKRYGHIVGWEEVEYTNEYTSPHRRHVRDALLDWARTHNLEVEWVLNAALHTLHMWCWGRYNGRFARIGEAEEMPYEADFTLTIRHADLKLRTFEEELKRFDNEYRRARDTYFTKATARYEQWGKKADERRKFHLHLEWFVQSRVLGWDDQKIADNYNNVLQTARGIVTNDAVRKSRERLANMLTLDGVKGGH